MKLELAVRKRRFGGSERTARRKRIIKDAESPWKMEFYDLPPGIGPYNPFEFEIG
jgi:hypothetical protein